MFRGVARIELHGDRRAPARDLLLASAGAELRLRYGWSLAAWFDGEFAEHAQRYAGTGRLRYVW